MTQEIPVIDLEAALGGSPHAGVLDAVRAAAEQIGIVQVVNHGIDADRPRGWAARRALGRLAV